MADEPLHSIKLKRNGVEFEMTAAPEDVARAWASLRETVVSSFSSAALPGNTASSSPGAQPATREREQPRTPRRGAKSPSGAAAVKASHLATLLGAKVDEFPEIGNDPPALYSGYATLRWAKATLDIDGLTATDIQEFQLQKLRIKNTSNAYRMAFSKQPRAVDATNTRPAVYRLMQPGERALDAYLAKVQQGATAAEAEAAGQRAEEEAEEA